MNVQLQLLVLIAFAVVMINGQRGQSDIRGRVCPASSLPDVDNAQHPVVTDPLNDGSVVTYTCNAGYYPAPGNSMEYTCDYTCGETGQWTGNPACLPRSCPASDLLDVDNAKRLEVTGALTVGSVVTYTCNDRFAPARGSNMEYTCNPMGEWAGNATCLLRPPCTDAVTASDGSMWRLCDGDGPGLSHPSKGRIEVNFDGTWGTVCDDNAIGWSGNEPWTVESLNVACKTLGFSGSNGVNRRSAYFGQGTGPILMDNVACLGSETLLTACYHERSHNCWHGEDQGVECV